MAYVLKKAHAHLLLNSHTPVSTVCETHVTTHLALRARLNTVNTHGFSVDGRHLFHAIRNRSYKQIYERFRHMLLNDFDAFQHIREIYCR